VLGALLLLAAGAGLGLLGLLGGAPLGLEVVVGVRGREQHRLARGLGRERQLLVGLQEAGEHHRGGSLAGDRAGEHHPHRGQPPLLDERRRDLLELLLVGVVGVIAEGLDALGQARVAEDRGDLLQAAVHPPPSSGGPQREVARRRVLEPVVGARPGDLVERLLVILGQLGEQRRQLLVGHLRQGPIEQGQGLQTGLQLTHGATGYRRVLASDRQ